jgi:hypothetical protein
VNALASAAATVARGVLGAVCYLSLSAAFWLAQARAKEWIRAGWDFIWIFGPPANLVHGKRYLWAYLLGSSLVVLGFAWRCFGKARASSAWWVAMVSVWLIFGALSYAPTF